MRIMKNVLFFFKQKTAYEMRISDWSSDVCSSDLRPIAQGLRCASIAHPRLEIDLVDLKPPAVTACLHNDVDEHAKESANIVAGEIAAAFRFLDEQRQLFERAGG